MRLALALCLIGTTATAMPREKCVAALADAYAMETAISEIVSEATRTTRIYAREGKPEILEPASAMTDIEVQLAETLRAYQDALFELCKKS